jgi:chorismate synthase
MNELKTFRKIAKRMIEKGINLEQLSKMVDLDIHELNALLADNSEKKFKFSNGVMINLQDFNKKHFEDYLVSIDLDNLPEGEKLTKKQIQEEMERLDAGIELVTAPLPEKEEKVIPPSKDSNTEGEAVQEAIGKALSDKRKRERAQEKLFHEKLLQLYDYCPDHMTVDVTLKRK